MKYKLLYLLVIMGFSLFAQENNIAKNPLNLNPNTEVNRQEVGSGFQFVSFSFSGIETDMEREQLQNELSQNPSLKKVEITRNNQFLAFVKIGELNNLKSLLKVKGLFVHENKDLCKKTSSELVSDDFPKYVDTGNESYDNNNYKIAKANWIQENPERYKAMFEKSTEELEKEAAEREVKAEILNQQNN